MPQMLTNVLGDVKVPTDITHRYDVLFLFDVKDSNPNGDPDTNCPRQDAITQEGMVSDVCLKRKVRKAVIMLIGAPAGYDMLMKEKSILGEALAEVYGEISEKLDKKSSSKKKGSEDDKLCDGEIQEKGLQAVCKRFFDARWFGGVLSTKKKETNFGQLYGPIQMSWSRTFHPIEIFKPTITPTLIRTEEQEEDYKGFRSTMGEQSFVRYGLYHGTAHFSPHYAKKTGFTAEDLEVFWNALAGMFWWDRNSRRPYITMRRVIVFEHSNGLGNAPDHKLFGAVTGLNAQGIRAVRLKNDEMKPSQYEDYIVPGKDEIETELRRLKIKGVTVHDLI